MSKLNPSCISDAYNKYYRNGFYTSRYPNSNSNVVESILNYLPSSSKKYNVLDYGCGNGRYLDLVLKQTNSNVYGFDISHVAIDQAQKKLVGYEGRASFFCLSAELDKALDDVGKMDLVLLLFGVLSHIESESKRRELLARLFSKLKKGNGIFILSVPNKRRRFLFNQLLNQFFNVFTPNALNTSDINYSRVYAGEKINLSYHLYSCKELIMELNEAGFTIEKVTPESIFPEKYKIKFSLLSRLDDLLCKLLPAWMGYGILAVVRRAQ